MRPCILGNAGIDSVGKNRGSKLSFANRELLN